MASLIRYGLFGHVAATAEREPMRSRFAGRRRPARLQRLTVSVAVALVISSVVAVAPADATTPGSNGRIAAEGSTRLLVMDADGGNAVFSTPTCLLFQPSWTPDATRIVFDGGCSTAYPADDDIFSVQPDGSGIQTLVTSPGSDTDPSMSPDGTRLLFVSTRRGNEDVFQAQANGTHARRLTSSREAETWPAWSPDGKHIAFVAHRGQNCNVDVINADGTHVRALTHDTSGSWPDYLECPGGPTWSPDGHRIAYPLGIGPRERLWWSLANGTNARRLTSSPGFAPEWSPDGTRIAYEARDPGGISVITADGSQTKIINVGAIANPTWEPLAADGPAHVWFSAPQSSTVGRSWTLTGALVVPGGNAAGQSVDLYATPPGGVRTLLASTSTDGIGEFSEAITPGTAGKWTYEADWGGDATHSASSFTLTVDVTLRATALTLSPSAKRITVGKSVSLTAKLVGAPARSHITISRVRPDGTSVRVASGAVDRHGYWRGAVKPTVNTRYIAKYSGAKWYASAESTGRKVSVGVIISVRETGYYTTVSGYHLYRSTPTCRTRHVGCPGISATVRPREPGVQVGVCLGSRQGGGRWGEAHCGWFRLDGKSQTSVIITYRPAAVVGREFREMVVYTPDDRHPRTKTRWRYFKIV